jgi:23S rRNA (pseudouridine1915-N3)-methyltransferase
MKRIHLALIFVGRASDPYIREGCRIYEERIRRVAELRLVPIPEERVAARGRKEYILQQEGRRIREILPPEAFTVALDEKGKLLTSEAFARSLDPWSRSGSREIAFILGGPYGLEESLKEKADFRLSFSTMTVAHGLARMLLMEQVYRAFSLLRGEPYHK